MGAPPALVAELGVLSKGGLFAHQVLLGGRRCFEHRYSLVAMSRCTLYAMHIKSLRDATSDDGLSTQAFMDWVRKYDKAVTPSPAAVTSGIVQGAAWKAYKDDLVAMRRPHTKAKAPPPHMLSRGTSAVAVVALPPKQKAAP